VASAWHQEQSVPLGAIEVFELDGGSDLSHDVHDAAKAKD